MASEERVEEVAEPKQVYDIVVFGATGFTGQYVVDEIARTADEVEGLTWAVAGRSMQKLQAVLTESSKRTGKDLSELPIIIADLKSEKSLQDMCAQAKVLLNCVGPYRFFGDQVVRACIEKGAHHLDISGEPQFLENTQLLYNSKAKEKKVYIIGACGFDSIPADLGVIYARDQFPGDLNSVEGYLKSNAGPSGVVGHFATWQSAIHGFAHASELVNIRRELYPNPFPRGNHKLKKRPAVFKSTDVNSWCVPFPGSDRSVVQRTQRYNHDVRKERAVQYDAYFQRDSLLTVIGTIFVGMIFALFAKFSFGRYLLEKFPAIFSLGLFTHAGPSKKQIEEASFTLTLLGQGYSSKLENLEENHTEAPDKKIVAKVSGPEMGYVTTPICLVQAAYVVLREHENLPKGGGVFTPGGAFAKTKLIERLDKHNVKFQLVE